MAEKSPLAHALEKNTKALQAVHKSRGQAGGAGAGAVGVGVGSKFPANAFCIAGSTLDRFPLVFFTSFSLS